MEIIIHSTDRIVTLNSKGGGEIQGRVWEGNTDTGIPVVCVVTRIAAPLDRDQTEFRRELEEHEAPGDDAIAAFPLRMVI